MGSWKIMLTCEPRSFSISRFPAARMSVSPRRMLPPVITPGVRDQAKNGEGGGGFAGAGFAYEAQRLAALQLKVHVVDRLNNAVVGAELHT